jgi:hypothetical protein
LSPHVTVCDPEAEELAHIARIVWGLASLVFRSLGASD